MTELELTLVRRAYARHIAFLAGGYGGPKPLVAGADDPRLEQALLDVHRDAFVGDGPWLIAGAWPRRTPDAEPHWVYQDVTVALVPEKALNNGQPSFLAYLIGLGRIQSGEHVVHIGAGVGYYTAIMAELVGRAGWVTAIELEPTLAARAAANLKAYPQVEVVCADGTTRRPAPADVVFVNAGASRPMDVWLDTLQDGGRLILPLCVGYKLPDGTPMTRGGIFLIERQGDGFAAAWKSATGIYPCFGAQDPQSEASLTEALRKGGADKVRRLVRSSDVPPETCWAKGPGWALTFA